MRHLLYFLILISCIVVINADHDGFANAGDDTIQSVQVQQSISSTIAELQSDGLLPSDTRGG